MSIIGKIETTVLPADQEWRQRMAALKTAKGIRDSADHAGEVWRRQAIVFVRGYLRINATMMTDDLWAAGLEKSESDRGLGSIIRYAIKQGWMHPLKDARGYFCCLPSCASNGGLKQVWESNLYKKAENPDK